MNVCELPHRGHVAGRQPRSGPPQLGPTRPPAWTGRAKRRLGVEPVMLPCVIKHPEVRMLDCFSARSRLRARVVPVQSTQGRLPERNATIHISLRQHAQPLLMVGEVVGPPERPLWPLSEEEETSGLPCCRRCRSSGVADSCVLGPLPGPLNDAQSESRPRLRTHAQHTGPLRGSFPREPPECAGDAHVQQGEPREPRCVRERA
jgi:hypothetical protein